MPCLLPLLFSHTIQPACLGCFLPQTPKLFMPTFHTYEGDYCDGIAAWWGLISTFVWVFPTIHNPDGLFVYFCSANLTYHQGLSIRFY